jgi:hypothetical protein
VRQLCCALLVSLVVVLGAPPAAAEGGYSPPVGGTVIDPFRPPATPYGPGNRGIDYATSPGEEVRAADGGEVVFAGRVGLSQHVVVLHPDGLRTSYSFLAEVDVRRGDHVERGDVVGRAGEELHFGVRAGDTYLDPMALLRGEAPEVHLVPVAGSEGSERAGLLRSLLGVVRTSVHAGQAGVAWARGEVGAAWEVAQAQLDSLALTIELLSYYAALPRRLLELGDRAQLLRDSQAGCTPSSVAPRRRRGRHLAILVGGLGSSAGHAAVLDVDTRALGYDDGDVAQFSYRGGQAPGRRHLDGVRTTTYDADDADGDLRVAARRLRSFVADVAASHPGVPIDLIAHSQGGVVARLAGDLPVEHLVTLGTPHHGADLATADAGLGTSAVGALVQGAIGTGSRGAVDPFSTAARQLAETSDVIEELERTPVTGDVPTIGARGDLGAPGLQTAIEGATDVLVPLEGVPAHDELPGSPEAAREIALALAGQGPTCRSLLGDLLLAGGISLAEDGVGAAGLVGGHWADHRLPGPEVPTKATSR